MYTDTTHIYLVDNSNTILSIYSKIFHKVTSDQKSLKNHYLDTLTSIISLWISTMVTIIKHIELHCGLHQSKVIHGSHHALQY